MPRSKRRILREIILFSMIGGVAFAVDVAILYLLKDNVGIFTGRAVSFFCAVITTWILNRNLTFRRSRRSFSILGEFIRYLIVMMGGGGINYLLFAWLVTTNEKVAKEPFWGIVAGTCAGMLLNFILAKSFIYKSISINRQ